MDFIDLLNELIDSSEKQTEEMTASDVLEYLENIGYICGDLMMIPKKEFYDLVSKVIA